MAKKQMKYLAPDSTQTLREGVAELRQVEGPEGDAAESFAQELRQDIDVHDAIHVLFGCPTTLAGEIIAHVWTAFGTTASIADMHRVNAHGDHRAVLASIGHWRLFRTWLASLKPIATTLRNTRRMTQRWPVERMAEFYDRRLVDIRDEFGIRLVGRRIPPGGTPSTGAALRHVRRKRPDLLGSGA